MFCLRLVEVLHSVIKHVQLHRSSNLSTLSTHSKDNDESLSRNRTNLDIVVDDIIYLGEGTPD